MINKFSKKQVLFIFTINLIILYSISLLKYYTLSFNDWDLAFFTQATWNIAHGSAFSSVFEIPFFSNHSNIFLYFILPIFYVFPSALTLLTLKALSLTIAAYVIFKLGRDFFSDRVALFISFLFLIYPPNIFAFLYDFHFESLSPGLLALLFYFFHKNNFKAFLITALVTLTLKENMPLIIIAFGLLGFFKPKDKLKWGGVILLLGFITFYFLTSIFIPFFGNRTVHAYMGNYSSLGGTPSEIILSSITKPTIFLSTILTHQNIHLIKDLFVPVAFIPLIAPHIIFLAVPILLQHLLSSVPQEKTIFYHYYTTISPFIFVAIIFVLAKIKQRKVMLAFVLTIIFILTSLTLWNFRQQLISRWNVNISPLIPQKWALINQIPKDASVIATFEFLAPLATRRNLYGFYKIHRRNNLDPTNFVNERNIEYALINFSDSWLQSDIYHQKEQTIQKLNSFFQANNWKIIGKAGNSVLYLNTDVKHPEN